MTTVKGHNGTIEFDGKTVSIVRSGFFGRGTFGKGEKHIPVRQITAVQVKPVTMATVGFIQFSIGGGNERNVQKGHRTLSAGTDENSVTFTKKQQDGMMALRDEIERAIANGDSDPVAQLEKLAGLHDAGVLTDDEFEAKKTALLDRM